MGDQRALAQNDQRRQDISFRIAELREDFGVRIARQQEDFVRRRDRTIEDATARRDRQPDEGLGSELGGVLETAVKNAIASGLAGYLTGSVFDKGVSLITAGLGALGIKEALSSGLSAIGNFLGIGSGEGEGEQEEKKEARVKRMLPALSTRSH